jgi:hypothetical protein
MENSCVAILNIFLIFLNLQKSGNKKAEEVLPKDWR